MRRLAVALAWGCAAVALAAFFLPWLELTITPTPAAALARLGRITLEVRRGDRVVTTDTSALSRLPPSVTGAQIPGLVRGEDAQAALTLAELITGKPQQAEAKSLAVYLVPGLALLGAAIVTWAGRRGTALGVAVAAGGIALAGAWKLTTLPASTSAVAVGMGLWVSVAAYVGLAASAAMCWCVTKGAE